jgi:hypothetical protein
MTKSALIPLVALLLVPGVTAAASPKVLFHYSEVFDLVCARQTKNAIKPEWVKELRARQEKLLSAWHRDGPRLLRATVKIAGHRFRREALSATLSLCTFPPMSHPLLINMRPYIRSCSKRPRGTVLLVGTVHHELLHHYLMGRRPKQSALLRKYEKEPHRVRIHLHLLALQKAAYLQLGWKKRLQQVIESNNRIPGGLYRRAWDIVKKEGHEAFVKELRTSR